MLKICFVTPELAPLAKVGGLADVSQSLPAALAELGHDVRVILPRYRDLHQERGRTFTKIDNNVELKFGESIHTFNIFETEYPRTKRECRAPRLYLIDCPELYDRPEIYGDAPDEHLRFLLLSQGAIEICQRLQWAPNVFHINDWVTAILPLLLKTVYGWDNLFRASRTVLTIHNIGHQGIFPPEILESLNLGAAATLLARQGASDPSINLLKTGVLYSDLMTAVSPTYAREIQTDEYGMGLQHLLRARRDSLFGIVNGIDTNAWNPATDSLIPARFNADDPSGKKCNRSVLLETLGLSPSPTAPVIGVVSRLTHQKGFETLYDSMPILLSENDIRLAVLGNGQPEYLEFFENLEAKFPDQVAFENSFDNKLAHLVEAGSDIFLMPSLYEPCGLNQMYSQIYGTIPIVRKTGGLADTVTMYDPASGKGTGIVFEAFSNKAVLKAIRQAIAWFHQPEHWNQMITNAMRRDFSWNKSARQYAAIFQQLTNLAHLKCEQSTD
ncbi:MAG: glycogen synthase [Mariniblastus sp.]|nr:glycogen synthase [Mariniblastus sp.]